VDFEHEGVEVNPALAGNGERFVEQVHEHRLAAPDAAPQVNAADAIGPVQGLAEQAGQPAGGMGRFEIDLERFEPLGRGGLLRVGAQLAGFDERAVAAEEAAQATRSASSFLVSAMALAGLSPLGQTLAQFMIVWQR
jgi:hypothetical protein